MRIAQQCTSCQSVYGVSDTQYRVMRLVYCPACGHPNKKMPASQGKIGRMATQVIDLTGNNRSAIPTTIGNTRNRAGISVEKIIAPRPVEILRRRIEDKGKAFIIGGSQHVAAYDMQLVREANISSIGVGDAWKLSPYLDALIIDDYKYVVAMFKEIHAWTNANEGKYIFIKREMGDAKWVSRGKQHGLAVDRKGKVLQDFKLPFKHANVQYYDTAENFQEYQSPLVLLDGAFPSAANLAYILGAREIVCAGIDQRDMEGPDDLDIKHCGDDVQFEKACCTEMSVYITRLQKKIAQTGKCFVLGAAPSLNQLPLQRLFGFPVFGTNASFQIYPHMDGLFFGDVYFIQHYGGELGKWQSIRDEKPVLFWQNYGGGSKLLRVFSYIKGQPSHCIHENLPGRIMPIFSLKHSIITVAINAAYWLGAKEIFLLGVEFGAGHFFDPDGQIYKGLGKVHDKFPNVEKIVPFIKQQADYLLKLGVVLYTCWDGDCALKGVIPYKSLEEAADGRYLTQLKKR